MKAIQSIFPLRNRYWPWLIVEIIKANIDVARIIVAPKMKTGLCVFECDASQKSDIGQVAYANSITLTPGTVTIGMENGRLTVHALTFEGRDGILAGEMDRRVSNMENIFADTTTIFAKAATSDVCRRDRRHPGRHGADPVRACRVRPFMTAFSP